MKKILEIRNLNTIATDDNDKRILKGLNLKINKVEIHVIMGPNGGGKSSLANTIFSSLRYIVTDGSIKHYGEENENCCLLSDKALSKSLPALLCHEEDVVGFHGVSTGKIEQEKLFYLMTRGLSKKEVLNLLVKTRLNTIINKISDNDTIDELNNNIDILLDK